MMRKGILVAVSILLVSVLLATAGAQESREVKSLSLEEAVNYALENSQAIKLAQLAVEEAEVSYKEADSAYDKIKNIPSADSLETYKLKEGYYRDLAKMGLTLAEKAEEQAREAVKFSVESAYFDLLFARDKVELQKDILEAAQKDMDIVNKKYELGMVAQIDVLSTQANLESARYNYNQAVRDAEYKLMSFNKTLGLPLKTEVELTDELTYSPPPEVDLEEKVAQALENRYEVIAAGEQYRVDKMNFDLTSVWYTPNTYVYKHAKYQMESSHQSLLSTQQEVELSVRKAYMDMIGAYEGIRVMDKNVERLEKAYNLTRLRYDVGMATSYDVINALNALNQVRLQRLQAIHAYNLARKQFEVSYGIGISSAGGYSAQSMPSGM